MKKINQEIEKIEALYNQAIELTKNGLIDASLMYCRKIIEGIFIVIQDKEKIIDIKIPLSNRTIYTFEKHIKAKYPTIPDTETFFERLELLQELGNRAVQFVINEPEINISKNDILTLLTFIFEWFTKFITTYHKKKESKDVFFDNNNIALPFCIKYLKVENYQTLKKLELNEIPVDTRFVVFTGDNGEGKTSILQSIAIGMYGDYDENSNLILCDKPNVNITIEAKNKKQTIFNEYKGFRNQFSNIEINRNVIAYGASRLQLQSSESQDLINSRQSNVYGLFKTNNILLNIEYWLKIQILNGQEERINAVLKLLIKLMPSIEKIKIGDKEPIFNNFLLKKQVIGIGYSHEYPITYIENGVELKAEQLSAGNKSILAMIGDMIIRLYSSQPETINPSDLYGIVLIDELETHLHPKWQKQLPKLLTDNFPLIQFFVSTHSPIVFLGMPKNSVFYNITKNEKKETVAKKLNIDIENVLPHQILTSSLFGMDNIRNVYNKGIEFLSVETEIEKIERLKKEQKLKDLSVSFKFQLPKE